MSDFGLVNKLPQSKRKIEEEKAFIEQIVKDRTTALIDANKKLELEKKNLEDGKNILLQTIDELDKSLAAELESKKKIKELLDRNEKFVHCLSHDMMTPLTALLGILPILEMSISDEEIKDLVITCLRNAHLMRIIGNNVFTYADFSMGNIPIYRKKSKLYSLLNDFIETKSDILSNAKVEIINKIDQNLITCVDPEKFKIILYHLITNAVRYSQPNSKVIVDSSETENEVIISVIDFGKGMEHDEINHAFDEFYKADESRHILGTIGLGLNIAKAIVNAFGGKIWLQSSGTDTGTTCYFTIPKNRSSSIASLETEVDDDKAFVTADGIVIKNIPQLIANLTTMSDTTFSHHVNNSKNDFCVWLNDIFGLHCVAEVMSNTKTKENTIKIIKRFIEKSCSS